LCFAGAVYLLFFAGLLDLRSVSASGTQSILQADLKAAVHDWLKVKFLGISRERNLFFISSEKLASELVAKFPRINSVEVRKKLPHSLEILITEREPAGIWCFVVSDRCFYFDKNGVAYAETGKSSGFLIPNISDFRDREVTLGSLVASEEWFKNIIAVKELLPKIGINVAEFAIPSDSFDEFDAQTAEGWKLLFSTSSDVAKQITSLGILLRDKLPAEKRAGLQYVDLRIQDRIYYR